MAAKSDKPDLPADAPDVVGTYYEDEQRAEGLARLYEAPGFRGEFYRDRVRRIASLLEGVEGELLDAGCGTGQMLRFLRDSRSGAFALTGLDLSDANVEVAQRVLEGDQDVRLCVGRIESMPFETASFDVVLAMGSLEYVPAVEEALVEIARVTRPGGMAITTMQDPSSPYRLWESLVWSRVQKRRSRVESPVLHRLSKRRLRRALQAAGLTPFATVDYSFNVFLPPLDRKFPRLAMRAQRRLAEIARGPLRHLAADYIIAARR